MGTIIDNNLEKSMDLDLKYGEVLLEGMKYSLFTGGKRLRPIFGLKSFELYDNDIDKVMPYIMAVEMIHTYSLVHDDLPSMDDDDYRRGKKTNHIVFGEDIAILVGDALLNRAFEIMSEDIKENAKTIEDYRRRNLAMNEIGKYAGMFGMIGGQVVDIKGTDENMDRDKLVHMYTCKTAGLFQAAIVAGGIIGGASEEEIEILREFSLYLGLSYQIQDDILDYEEDKEINKLTYLTYYDKDKAILDMKDYVAKAIDLLDSLKGLDTSFLKDLTIELVGRKI